MKTQEISWLNKWNDFNVQRILLGVPLNTMSITKCSKYSKSGKNQGFEYLSFFEFFGKTFLGQLTSRNLKLMVTPQQILNNVSLLAEYQIHSEKKKSDSARKIFVKV